MNLTVFKNSEKSSHPHYLLFGHPVGHSLSPLMHNTALKYYGMEGHFYAIDLQSHELTDLAAYLNRDAFLGANITIPYKQSIIAYLDKTNEAANRIGAVNTIVKQKNLLEGHNTDFYGFLKPLHEQEENFQGQRAIIFGTGGATRAIVVALIKLGLKDICLVSRNPRKINSFDQFEEVRIVSYDQWTALAEEAPLIINATPLGMYPNVDQSPVREQETKFLTNRICYDIVYNPLKTTFLTQAEQAGAVTINGIEMFVQQGSRAFELWTGKPFPVQQIKEVLHERFNG